MRIEQVGVILSTIKDHVKTISDLSKSLMKIKQLGISTIQVSAVNIENAELAKVIRNEGMVCCATHDNGQKILHTPELVIERLQILGCKYSAFPFPADIDLSSYDKVIEFSKALDRSGAKLRNAGFGLLYHNHHVEFQRRNGHLILDLIYANTDKKNLLGEPDTYWIQAGGDDPAQWCKKLHARLPILHLKDYMMRSKNESVEPWFAEIGKGNLNWQSIFAEAEKSGCQWYIIEQDDCNGRDPFDSIKMSFDFIAENFVS